MPPSYQPDTTGMMDYRSYMNVINKTWYEPEYNKSISISIRLFLTESKEKSKIVIGGDGVVQNNTWTKSCMINVYETSP